ncbi:Phosphoglycerol transferase MdoB [Evansella caseinilytica]|uniref:Phosphoglycerol transferase MdoB n=1 Tax=Evansella caseinilytica TaxID=1503961 RepID=A0A1H3UXY8_9BACI|nr:LTA synthase family protein [Evansella caseinilytica]SDZ66851.1 Phosphoglycerol transferase MdoB [Evansella caseinilytica]
MKAFVHNHRFMLLCIAWIWLKTVIVSSLTFNINLHSFMDGVIFAVSPLAFLLVVFGIGIVFRPKLQWKYYFFICALLTGILYANTVYYREFSDIITLPMLSMGVNVADLSTSIFELIAWYDIFFFVDIVLIGCFLFRKPHWLTVTQTKFSQSKSKFAVIAIAVLTITGLTRLDDNFQGWSHSFNREHLVQSIGLYNFYVYDAFLHTQTKAQTVFADGDEWTEIERHLEANRSEANEDLFGIGKDMNVIVVSLESFQSFVINETVNGEEITPFLNELIKDSFYFDNFYYQTGQGKTSDAEFLINNSLYPLGRGAVFHSNYDNDFNGLPEILHNNGYYAAAFHANDKTFYNRDVFYENLGYDRYFSYDDYEVNDENSVGWGLKDIDWIEQSMDYVADLPKPFFGTFITLTNHFPYELEEEDQLIQPFDSDSDIVNRYFPTVRYTDEAMRLLVDQLKEQGIYENTILVMYGDHYGIAESHYKELEKYLGKEITPFEAIKLNRVPLIIHIPGMEGQTMNTVSGQIDVMPTLLNILGIADEDYTMFGSDLFAKDRDDYAVLRNGTVITDTMIFSNEICYNAVTGEETDMEQCASIRDRGDWDLYYSDKIIYSDLFRFR